MHFFKEPGKDYKSSFYLWLFISWVVLVPFGLQVYYIIAGGGIDNSSGLFALVALPSVIWLIPAVLVTVTYGLIYSQQVSKTNPEERKNVFRHTLVLLLVTVFFFIVNFTR